MMLNPRPVEEPDLSAASIVRFLKLADKHDLFTIIHATSVDIPPTLYAASSKTHRAGEVMRDGYEQECVFITITENKYFAASGAWYGGKFDHALVGGQRSAFSPPKMFTKITEVVKEIDRCLS